MDFSPDKLRPHFQALTKKREAIDKDLNPLRAELDKGGLTPKREETVRGKIRDLQQKLAPIEMERAAVARALGGKTGE